MHSATCQRAGVISRIRLRAVAAMLSLSKHGILRETTFFDGLQVLNYRLANSLIRDPSDSSPSGLAGRAVDDLAAEMT